MSLSITINDVSATLVDPDEDVPSIFFIKIQDGQTLPAPLTLDTLHKEKVETENRIFLTWGQFELLHAQIGQALHFKPAKPDTNAPVCIGVDLAAQGTDQTVTHAAAEFGSYCSKHVPF